MLAYTDTWQGTDLNCYLLFQILKLSKGCAGGFQEKLGLLRPDMGPKWPYSGLGSVLEGLKSRLS